VKQTAQKKRDKKTIARGFFQSPLFLGLLNFIPLILIVLGTIYCGTKIYQQINRDRLVLGAESSYDRGVTISVKDRLKQLTEISERVESEMIRNEIVRLKNL
jgi:hypothetical protein